MSLCRAHVNRQLNQPQLPCTTPLHKCPKTMLPQFALRLIDSTNRYAAMCSSMALWIRESASLHVQKRALSNLLTNLQDHPIFQTPTIFPPTSCCKQCARSGHVTWRQPSLRSAKSGNTPCPALNWRLTERTTKSRVPTSEKRQGFTTCICYYPVPVLWFYVLKMAFSKWKNFETCQRTLPIRPSCCNNCLNSAMVRGAEPPSRKRAEAAATVCGQATTLK